MKKRKGVALISVLLIMVVLFIISTGFLSMITKDAQSGMGQYQSDLTMMCADSGIEYGLFMIRHNCWMRATDGSNPVEYQNVVISELSYENSGGIGNEAQWLKAKGLFKLYKVNITTSEIRLRSTGEIQRSDGALLYKRTAYANVHVYTTDASSKNYVVPSDGTLRVDTWYEKWR